MSTFNTGDIVILKSGGPKMTVQRVIGADMEASLNQIDDYIKLFKGYKPGDVLCQWFVGNELKQGAFPPDSLVVDK